MSDIKSPIKKGLISVIMGNYNTPEHYLRESIDSILEQTFTDFEFIIVDDCSTDGSLKTIESYTDPRIKVIRNDKNLGLAASLNKALDICQGEFIARMDSDDVCFPQRFERQAEYMREHPDVILCGTQIRFIDENGDSPRGEWKTEVPSDPDIYRIHLLFSNYPMIVHPSWMFNHKLLRDHGIRYKVQYKYSQDFAMLVSCAACGRCTILPEVLLKYRNHGVSASGKHKKEQIGFDYQIIQEQLDELHLVMPDEIKPLHHRYLQHIKPYSKELKKWLNQIIKANKRYQVFNQSKLKKKIRRRWWKICFYHFFKRKKTN